MTKEQAMLKIKLARTCGNFEESQQEIGRIIDQIDQPGEFSVRELCEAIAATHDNHPDLHVELFGDESWIYGKFDGEGIDSLRAKLIELAKPEDPEVMVPMRLSLVKCCAEHWGGEVAKACKVALEKAKL